MHDIVRHPLTPDDGPALHAILGDPRVGPWHRPTDREDAFSREECDAFARRHAAHWTRFGYGLWLVRTPDGEPVAWGGAHHTEIGGRAEIELAWSVASAHWGKGLALGLARAGLELTAARGLTGVISYTRTDNARSIRVMEKAGLRRERELEHAGLPHVVYRAAG